MFYLTNARLELGLENCTWGERGKKVALLDEKCMSTVLGAAGRKLAGCKTSSTGLYLNPQHSAFLGPGDPHPHPQCQDRSQLKANKQKCRQ